MLIEVALINSINPKTKPATRRAVIAD